MSDFGWIPAEVDLLIWHFKVRRETQMITLTKVPKEPEKVCSGYADGHTRTRRSRNEN